MKKVDNLIDNTALSKVYNDKDSSPINPKKVKIKKPLIIYGDLRQPLLQSNPDILDRLDEY